MDLVGNRLSRTVNKPSTAYVDQVFASVYDSNDRLLTETLDNGINGVGVDQTTAYTWVGTEQSSKVVSGAGLDTVTQLFTYNLQGQLSRVENERLAGANTTSRSRVDYRYDAAGIRSVSIETSDGNLSTPAFDNVNGNRTEYLTDHQSLTGHAQTIIETTKNPSNQTIKRITTTFGLDEITQTTSVVDPSSQLVTQSSTLTFGHDGHGSVTDLFNAAGALIQAFQYSAYGDLLSIHNGTGSVVGAAGATDLESLALTNLLYSGEAFDARIGLQYLRARMVDLTNGRFITRDPFLGNQTSPLSFNGYAYTSGDPVQHNDPTGMFEGLAGLLSSMGISSGQRAGEGTKVGAGGKASLSLVRLVNTYQKALKILNRVKDAIEKIEDLLDLLDLGSAVYKLIREDLQSSGINGAVDALPNRVIEKDIKIPVPMLKSLKKLNEKLHSWLNHQGVSEFMGEMATAVFIKAIGFEQPKLNWSGVHGPDQLGYNKKTGFWGIFEAKGGSAKLSNDASYGPQMRGQWITHWIKQIYDSNVTDDATKLRADYSANKVMLAALAKLDVRRKGTKGIKATYTVAVQKYEPPKGANMKTWPKHWRQ